MNTMENSPIYQITGISPTAGTQEIQKELLAARESGCRYLFVWLEGYDIELPQESVSRMIQVADDMQASILYADYRVKNPDGSFSPHPLCDYQAGSVRDDFDFGPLMLISCTAIPNIISSEYSGLYALRLAFSAVSPDSIVHLRESLYTATEPDRRHSGDKQFDYVDVRNAAVQKERERVFTEYLKCIKSCLPPSEKLIDPDSGEFPVEASVIIPVRNRAATIADAVESALSQQADFPFNVIVVDNHSTDGTTEILQRIAAKESRLVHVIPESDNLGIGGCWELAINREECGRFAVQLDSDDKYKTPYTLTAVVECFRKERCAMVIGSYELTDFEGNPLPPGLIDHKEWTQDNGHNNALRINGLGAPRAFYTPVLRNIGVPNVSYGEDYALGLRISRRYRIGRIYDSLYLCRRWGGNSDANLSQERVNANNTYKDLLRTIEITARGNIIQRREETFRRKAALRTKVINDFIASQLKAWPLAATNYAALRDVCKATVHVGDIEFELLYNPARKVSSGANVDAAAIAERPCFLCETNRPAEQQSLDILPGYKLLVNPFPVFKRHFTIPSDTHQPQRLMAKESDGTHRAETLFRLAQELPGMTVFYNGAKCGASAPDHLHFQAVGNEDFHLFTDERRRRWPFLCYSFRVFSGSVLRDKLEEICSEISRMPENRQETEPRMNLFITAADGRYGYPDADAPGADVFVVPRRAHRPDFYGTSDDRMTLSPGALDVGGALITVRDDDFKALTDSAKGPGIIADLFRQITYPASEVSVK